MRNRELPYPNYIKQRLLLCPETGRLTWRSNPEASNSWNTRWSGKEAFTATSTGYKTGRVDGQQHLAHRVVWAIYYAKWPDGQIDHINGDRSDNRISNLRLVTNTENARNATISINNTSGVTGVWIDKRRNRWCAEIKVDRRKIHLGQFTSLQEAAFARKQAEQKYGFHSNHGKKK